MKKTLAATLLILVSGCGTIQMEPVDLALELEAFGGLFRIKPQVTIGDGEVGPTAIEVEVGEEKGPLDDIIKITPVDD